MCGATQPCSGRGSRSGPAASAPAISARLRRAGRAQQPVDVGFELRSRELADAGALQGATGVGVGKGRTEADPVEGADCTIAVVADRHLPTAPANQLANCVAAIAHVERKEAHPPTVSLVNLIDHVLLFAAGAAAARKPERQHERAAEEVTDPQRAGCAQAA